MEGQSQHTTILQFSDALPRYLLVKIHRTQVVHNHVLILPYRCHKFLTLRNRYAHCGLAVPRPTFLLPPVPGLQNHILALLGANRQEMTVYSVIQGGDIAIADIRDEGAGLLGLEIVLEDGVGSGEEAVGAVRSEGNGRVVIGLHELVCVLGPVERVDGVEDVVDSVGGQQRQTMGCTHHAFVVEMDFFGAKIILHFIL